MTDTEKPINFIYQAINEDLDSERFIGNVITRFPPEPNGYLHIGHAKSICLNFGMREEYPGAVCHLRLDDTNPSTESVEFVEAIKENVLWLGFDWEADFCFPAQSMRVTFQRAQPRELISSGLPLE